MPANNPLGYLPPDLQMQLLSGPGVAPPMEAPPEAILNILMGPKPFAPNELDLLDVRQGMRPPQWLADKYGVSMEQLTDAFPEFNQTFRGQAPGAGREQPRQPGQISAEQAAANERSREEQMRRIREAKERQSRS